MSAFQNPRVDFSIFTCGFHEILVWILQTSRVQFPHPSRKNINTLIINHLILTIMIKYSIVIKSTKPGTKKELIQETKAYGVAQADEILDLDKFCQHIADHNSPFSKGTIKGILTDAVSCLREQMLAGNKVKLGDLGDFHVELDTEGAVTTDDFSTNNIKDVNIRWTPSGKFKHLRQEATFQLVPSRSAQADAIEVVRNTDTIHGLE